MKCKSEYLVFYLQDLSMNNKSISTVHVDQGESELCLEEPGELINFFEILINHSFFVGVYEFLPNSCHNFEEKFYTFDV